MPDLFVDSKNFELLATDILNSGMRFRFKARGGSMQPFIQDGDLVEVMKVNPAVLRRGEIVLCKLSDGRLVVHRIVRIDQFLFYLQGDSLPYADGAIPSASIFGKIETIYRNNKTIRLNSLYMMAYTKAWLLKSTLHDVMKWLRSRYLSSVKRENKPPI